MVFGGVSGFIQHIRHRFECYRRNIYDREFKHLAVNIDEEAGGDVICKPRQFYLMRRVAESIGGQFDYARVDLFRLPDGALHLGEVTLCPGNCTGVFSDAAYESRFGDMLPMLSFQHQRLSAPNQRMPTVTG